MSKSVTEDAFGRAVLIQDVPASTALCTQILLDIPQYSRMVPNVQAVNVYSQEEFENVGCLRYATVTFIY